METEAFRQQKAEQQQAPDGLQQPQQQPFMNFSPGEAAAAREAAAQEAAQRKGTAGSHPSHAPGVPPSQSAVSKPAPPPTPHEAASAAIGKVRHQVDDLAKQVRGSLHFICCHKECAGTAAASCLSAGMRTQGARLQGIRHLAIFCAVILRGPVDTWAP